MVLPSSQDEALARYSVSKDVPGSVLKCETVLGTLDATPKVPRHTRPTQGEARGFSRVAAGFSSYDREFRLPFVGLEIQSSIRVARGSWGLR